MQQETKCDVCKQSASQKCGGCHAVYYCSKEHQKSGWKIHKKSCKPFKISEDGVLGRHLIATRNIKIGEIVLHEPPMIWGPSQVTVPVCLGCGKIITADNSSPCSKCGWPICSKTCENSSSHVPECHYTVHRGDKIEIKNFGVPHPSYQSVTILRCLYHKQFSTELWKKLDKLQSHCEERKQTPKYENDRLSIAQFIRRFFKLEDTFSEEEILRICGIVNVNGHEVPLAEPSYVSIYESTSMFEHSCKANCCKSFTSKGGILISAGEVIEKGSHLSICYTDPLWGTPNRRHHLHETKFFWCSCKRCADPTEFGSYFSAIRCNKEQCKGSLLPKTFLEENYDVQWFCNICNNQMAGYSTQIFLETLGRELAEMKKGKVIACRNYIEKHSSVLHRNHFYLTDVKLALVQLIGQEGEGGLPNISNEDLEMKANFCQQLIDLFKLIVPAEKRLLGIVLFELHAAIAEIGRRRATSGDGPEELHSALLESQKILKEAAELLKNEPEELPEGKIYKQAKQNLEDLEIVLRTVHKSIGDVPV